jgi:hypothetical protein
MGKIIVSENVSLDGVVQDPTARRAPGAAAGSPGLGRSIAKSGLSSNSTRRWAPRPCKNSTVLTGDVVDEVSKLKQRVNGEIVVYASRRLVHTLMEHDLVDELQRGPRMHPASRAR